jgi:hypothetical protein
MSAEELPTAPPAAPPRPDDRRGDYLTLVGLTPDGRQLRLVDLAGHQFTLDVDARLRAATAGPAKAVESTVETTKMDSMLRPRDIQARIRAGETPEAVAAAAGTPVEKVMPFAAPVLAEREHVAERAQKSSIRRSPGSGSGTGEKPRTLGDAVTGHLHARNVDPDVVTWDAWRREDGRWALAGRYSVQGRDGLAELTFDQPGNFVVLDNDDARWLVGELPDPVPAAEPAEVSGLSEPGVGVRRLSAVRSPEAQPEPEAELGDDALAIVEADQPLEAFLEGADQPDVQRRDEQHRDEQHRDEQLEIEVTEVEVTVEAEVEEPAAEADPEPEPPARRPVKKNRGRASVPSWDEIMFGGGPTEK